MADRTLQKHWNPQPSAQLNILRYSHQVLVARKHVVDTQIAMFIMRRLGSGGCSNLLLWLRTRPQIGMEKRRGQGRCLDLWQRWRLRWHVSRQESGYQQTLWALWRRRARWCQSRWLALGKFGSPDLQRLRRKTPPQGGICVFATGNDLRETMLRVATRDSS